MVDYGRTLTFGCFLTPDAADPTGTIDAARRLDEAGLDLVGIQDHPYQARYLDTWTLLSVIAARTDRIQLFPDVVSLPLRNPAVLAKAAASLDLISGGRVELGIGAGAFWEAIEAMGGRRLSPGASIQALAEAIDIIRLMWSGQPSIRTSGTYYSVHGVHPGPEPAHPIGIWVGAYKPRILRLTGRLADGWLPSLGYIDFDGLVAASATIDDAARSAGRQPGEIRRILNVGVTDPDELVDTLTRYAVGAGIDTFILGGDTEDAPLRHLVQDTIPRVRDAVASHRAKQ